MQLDRPSCRTGRAVLLTTLFGCASIALGFDRDAGSALALPDVQHLPLTRATALPIGLRGRNDKQATLLNRAGGGFILVFNSGVGADIADLHLYTLSSVDGIRIGATKRLALVDQPMVANPAFVRAANQHWLYFASSARLDAEPAIWRARVDENELQPAEPLPSVPGLTRMTGWPRWTSTDDDQVVLSFRDRRGRPHWAVHAPDQEPLPRQIEDVAAAYVRVIPMTGGGWLLTYQRRPESGGMLTYARTSLDAETWSATTLISQPAWPEVHDAFALPRLQQGADVYHSYPSRLDDGKGCFGLYRRAISAAGQLGTEEQVTPPGEFCAYSASAHRLADGAVLVTFSHILKSDATGVTEARNFIARLPGDAPAPE